VADTLKGCLLPPGPTSLLYYNFETGSMCSLVLSLKQHSEKRDFD
jgi:hypothetical protein